MPTGDKKTNFQQKRFLPQQRIEDTFFDYLETQIREVTSRVWASQRGVFGTANLTGGTDKFSVTTLPISFLDGDGNVLVLDGTDGTDIAVENANTVDYEVGLRHVEVPDGVVRNPRNDAIFYDTWEDGIGEKDFPDSVAEAAGTLEIVVDSVFETGVSHAGRLATVYLLVPVSDVESVAIERNLVVSWDGSNNKVTTAALLGQTGGSASTAVTDYQVVAQGVTVRRNTVLSTLHPYAFVGTVTGVGAGGTPTTATVGQVDVSDGINSSLDETYGNSGASKQILVVDGAVELTTPAAPADEHNAQLRLTRIGGSDESRFMLETIADGKSVPIAVFERASDGANLQVAEAVDQSGTQTLDFTRGGVALSASNVDLRSSLLVLDGSPEDGLYLITSVSATSVDVVDPQTGLAPAAWTTGVGRTAWILHPRFVVGASDAVVSGVGTAAELLKGGLFHAVDGSRGEAPLVVRSWPEISGGANALVLEGGGGSTHTGTPRFPLTLRDADGTLRAGVRPDGRVVTGHHHRDHFHYHPSRVSGPAANLPSEYLGSGTGSPTFTALAGAANPGGVLRLGTDGTGTGTARIQSPDAMHVDTAAGYAWRWGARLRVPDTTTVIVASGLAGIGNVAAYFLYDVGTYPDGRWRFVAFDASNPGGLPTDTGVSAGVGTYVNLGIAQLDGAWYWEIADGVGGSASGVESAVDSFAGVAEALHAYAQVSETAAAARELDLTYWEWVDAGEPLIGTLGNG